MTEAGRLTSRSLPVAVQMASDFAALADVDPAAEARWKLLDGKLVAAFQYVEMIFHLC